MFSAGCVEYWRICKRDRTMTNASGYKKCFKLLFSKATVKQTPNKCLAFKIRLFRIKIRLNP